jgi:hypothetical protein
MGHMQSSAGPYAQLPAHPPLAYQAIATPAFPPSYSAPAAQPAVPPAFDPTKLDPNALREEILAEKREGTAKKKKPREGVLRVAGGEKWMDDKLDVWPENDFRIFVGNLGPEVRLSA